MAKYILYMGSPAEDILKILITTPEEKMRPEKYDTRFDFNDDKELLNYFDVYCSQRKGQVCVSKTRNISSELILKIKKFLSEPNKPYPSS